MSYKKIGIVVADDEEYAPLLAAANKLGALKYTGFLSRDGIIFKIGNTEVVALYSGVGKVNSAAAAMHLVDIGCDALLNYGLSGGINNAKRGEIVFPERFIEHDFFIPINGYKPCEKPLQKYIYEADKTLLEKALLCGFTVKGTAATGDRFINNDSERAMLSESFGAVSCDMESAAIAYVCDFAGVPFAAMRKISDNAGDNAEIAYRELNRFCGSELIEVFMQYLCKLCGE